MIYKSVSITNYQNDRLNQQAGFIYELDLSTGAKAAKTVDFETAHKALAKLSKELHAVPKFYVNYLNPTISYRELSGLID